MSVVTTRHSINQIPKTCLQGADGSTPVHLASSYGYMDILDILLKSVAFIFDSPIDQEGMLPIHRWVKNAQTVQNDYHRTESAGIAKTNNSLSYI